MGELYFISKYFQSDSINLASMRAFFYAAFVNYPGTRAHLCYNVSTLHSPGFEMELMRLKEKPVLELTREEIESL